ncbi:hypothetical protein LUZ61_021123 [Rhynchospora tenuis]|uniref:Protein kinase domain-containing protein n=1 Tax=Rhynchospora tenuis TaxID=198213 RepID=A0AAD5W8P9_9POAL|nr:hypothetical protein LUZ61_021123 [Rhynchospora tenuis]
MNYNIASKYADDVYKKYLTVRSFPNGTRNCYTLRPVSSGSKYLIRALFVYGNYDNKNNPPNFDIHLGVNYWDTVDISIADDLYASEIIATATSDYLQVCLVKKDRGTPFISVLELRPLMTTLYKDYANSNQSLVYFDRGNIGTNDTLVRYPDDPYDRLWWNYTKNTWTEISTNSTFDPDTDFGTPSIVMQTAAITSSVKQPLELSWTLYDYQNKTTIFLVILHFGEIQDISPNALRQFDIFYNGKPGALFTSIVPDKLYPDWARYRSTGYDLHNVSLNATSNSTLPPLLNAIEVYVVTPATGIPTYSGDVTAINNIKASYHVKKDWTGDPCVPSEFSWTGVTCTSDSINIPRITSLNLSSAGLTGAIVSSFGNLSSLKSLDVIGNSKISTTLPSGLQKRIKDGNLTFRFGGAPPASTPSNSSDNKKSPVVIIAVAGVVVLLFIAAVIMTVVCLKRRNNNQISIAKPNENTGSSPLTNSYAENYTYSPPANISNGNNAAQNYANISKPNKSSEGMLNFENRQFTYNDLKKITNSFQNNIGTGGFGSVYVGTLENGTQVAVKMRSHSSSQGVKEFLAEAQNLTRVHHKNLVSLIGYCMDEDCMALVYEYMKEGTLQDKLTDNARPLTWKQRVRIAYESALGLEYLHKACNPPLIHRDVKTSNILLNANLEAKIADFGLSRAFNNDCTLRYYSSFQLSEKSDVFSFGVVLFEVITGQPPIIGGPEGGHVTNWVSQRLSRGDIESIIDPRIHGQYDINSVWKVTDLARKCTENSSVNRPAMNVVVMELKESLDLEISTEGTRSESTAYNYPHNYSRNDHFVSDVSQNSAFEMAYMGGPAPGPSAR